MLCETGVYDDTTTEIPAGETLTIDIPVGIDITFGQLINKGDGRGMASEILFSKIAANSQALGYDSGFEFPFTSYKKSLDDVLSYNGAFGVQIVCTSCYALSNIIRLILTNTNNEEPKTIVVRLVYQVWGTSIK